MAASLPLETGGVALQIGRILAPQQHVLEFLDLLLERDLCGPGSLHRSGVQALALQRLRLALLRLVEAVQAVGAHHQHAGDQAADQEQQLGRDPQARHHPFTSFSSCYEM